jgi:ATP-binding cassette subfamily F protein uup
VTHDRYFLDKVATAILAFEGNGKATRYPGNFEMYSTLRPKAGAAQQSAAANSRESTSAQQPSAKGARKPAKLSYKEQRELEGMEQAIEAAEARKAAAEAALADPANYANAQRVPELQRELSAAGIAVEGLYMRWQELQDRGAAQGE